MQPLRGGEYLQFLRDAIKFVSALPSPPPPLAECLADVVASEAAIAALYGKAQGSRLTAALEALDARRDAAITGIRMVADAYTRHPADDKRNAGEVLSLRISLYGNIAGDNYKAESAELGHLARLLTEDAALAAAVATLHLGDWVAELSAAHDAFDEKYMQRTAELAETCTPTNIKDLRVQANKRWYALREKISAYHIINDGSEPWASLVARLNALIAQYVQTIRVREGRSAARRRRTEDDAVETAQ